MANKHPVSPGIGYGEDLRVRLQEDPTGRWHPQVRAGYFYVGGREDYLYAQEGRLDTAAPSGFSTLATGVPIEATRQGPLLVEGRDGFWARMSAPLAALRPMAWVAGPGELLYANVPGTLHSVTDYAGKDLSSVPTTGFLNERGQFFWDPEARRVWVRRALNDPNRLEEHYATYLKDAPELRQEEVVLVDDDGNIRTMLGPVSSLQPPEILVPGRNAFPGFPESSSTVIPGIPVAPGTRVGVRYYVKNSYVVEASGTAAQVRAFSESGGPVVVRWEAARREKHFEVRDVQINPVYDGGQGGFVYLKQKSDPARKLGSLLTTVSSHRVSNVTREPLRILVQAFDTEGYPLPDVNPIVWIGPWPDALRLPQPVSPEARDFSGKSHWYWNPDLPAGTYTVHAQAFDANGTLLEAQEEFEVDGDDRTFDIPFLESPKLYLYLSPNRDADGMQALYVYMAEQGGTPYPGNADFIAPHAVVFCRSGKLFPAEDSANPTGSGQIELAFLDGWRVASCRYLPNGPDEIVARAVTNGNPEQECYLLTGAAGGCSPAVVPRPLPSTPLRVS